VELLDYIRDLLLKNDYVILPGLGGFSGHYKSAKIYKGNFTPPCKSICFDKDLKYNDNLLIDYIINKERISHTEASNKVNRSVKNIIYRLGEGDKIEIPDIGILQYDLKGNLFFTEQVNKNFNISSFGMPSFKIESSTHKEKELKETRNKYWFWKKYSTEKERPVQKNEPVQGKIIITKKNIPMSKPIQKKKTNFKKENFHTKKDIEKKETVEQKKTPPTKESDSKGMMLLKSLLVLAVIIVTALIINKELDKKHDNTEPVKENISVPAQTQDSLAQTENTEKQIVVTNDTVTNIKENSNSQKVFKNPETVSSSNGSYFIIGGVFKSQSHAVKYMDKMKSEGYTNIQDINFSKDLHYVSIDRFSTLNDAKAAKKKILTKDPKSGVWIYKKH